MPINILLKNRGRTAEEVLFPDASEEPMREWIAEHEEGQLAIDVFETDQEIIVKTAIAGVTVDDLEVFLHNDMLTIRGQRHADVETDGRYLVRECHWGSFSRSVILPTDIDPESIAAELKDGILTVRMTKVERTKKIEVNEIE